MSKMPAKKKSCFQITSVTQAQVAASSITDDTESLDDPDESRTEYVSSEMFEPDACDQSSFEETLNNLGETEALGAASSHIPQDVQLPAVSGPSNGGFSFRSTVVPANPHVLGAGGPSSQSHKNPVGVLQQSATFAVGSAANVSQPPPTSSVATSASTTSCGSRFRVIKLDHGTGEPFRRGRWTCTEFYEKDSESSVVQRTVDSIKHASTTDQNMDRDSGLGATVGSVATPSTLSAQGPDSNTDGSFTTQLQTAELQSYGIGHQNASGNVAHSASQPPTYTVVPSTQPLTVPAQQQIGMQPPAPQSLLPPGHNGIQTFPLQQVQNSPGMLPANQTQQFAYPAQPQQHLPALIPSNPVDYRQQHLPVVQPQGTTAPTLPVSSLPTGPSVSQGPSPVMTPAASGAQVLGLLGQPGEPAGSGGGLPPCSQPPPAQGLVQHAGSGGGVPTVPAGVVQQQQSTSQPPPSGVAGNALVSISPHVVVPGVQNVPTTVPISSSTPLTMPNQALSSVGQSLTSQPQATRSGTGLAKQGLPINFGQLPLIQVDEKQRKSDALPQTSITSGKEFTKPLIPESLQLHAPSVNSLFGMSITIDGDDDSASGASVVAIDNKIEQAMDLVKSHLMYAVREEVEVLKEQIKELYERNSVLERENAVLKSLANNDQLSQLSVGLTNPCSSTSLQHPAVNPVPQEGATALPHPQQPNVSSA